MGIEIIAETKALIFVHSSLENISLSYNVFISTDSFEKQIIKGQKWLKKEILIDMFQEEGEKVMERRKDDNSDNIYLTFVFKEILPPSHFICFSVSVSLNQEGKLTLIEVHISENQLISNTADTKTQKLIQDKDAN